ncbi:RNase H-like domain found in reverse transcriptase [Phytophthora infestans]|uniref:RNase H-like domain found in reverse transcriptase n=1 Tax=Phytophthora infestans TaxID=4787 RepID=A0A8S9UER1_PHYIN|nr:RNase H-like domain found in reverse transcriptase [Phytophthora infestans]
MAVGADQQQAFEWVKSQLVRKPVLAYTDYQLPFTLTTDASKIGLGAVLSQDYGHGDQPIAFASKTNNPAVAQYSVTELECLAVVWAVKRFRPHLYGRKFTVVTDHVALRWLLTAKDLAGRLYRWALALQEYDFDVEYRPGRENSVADAHATQ